MRGTPARLTTCCGESGAATCEQSVLLHVSTVFTTLDLTTRQRSFYYTSARFYCTSSQHHGTSARQHSENDERHARTVGHLLQRERRRHLRARPRRRQHVSTSRGVTTGQQGFYYTSAGCSYTSLRRYCTSLRHYYTSLRHCCTSARQNGGKDGRHARTVCRLLQREPPPARKPNMSEIPRSGNRLCSTGDENY